MQVLGGKLIEFGEFRLDAEKKILWRGEEVVSLPLKSIELLCVLIENRGEVVGKNDLIERVWKNSFVEDSVLTQNIYLLRKTLKTNGDANLIKNVPRRGYLFGGDVREFSNGADLSEPPAVADGFKFQTNGADTIIERHLVETIEYEEAEDEKFGVPPSGGISRAANAIPPKDGTPNSFYLPAAAIILIILAGAYFYFRLNPRQNVASAPTLKLKSVASPSAVKTLAVLPLRIADENEKSFAASFADDLSARLGSLNEFSVVPFALVGERGRVGAELKADYVLDGEVSAAKNLYTANLRLLDAKTGAPVLTENFKDADLIRLQDAISNKTSQTILNQLSPREKETISKSLPTNLAAYENFQTGYALWRRRADGKEYFKKAIELDQNFARAYVGLASQKMMEGGRNSPEAKEAEQLLQRAFESDENLADAYAAQGFIRIFHRRDWAGAEASLKNALFLDANNANAHHWLAVLYSIQRRLNEAKLEMNLALELDPTNPTLLGDMGQLHYFAGERDAAVEYCRRAIEFAPNHLFANQYLSQINQSATNGDRQATLHQAELLAKNDSFTLPYINVDPLYADLRDDPRFQIILRKINF